MNFEIDRQTIADLNIYSASSNIKSIAGLFDQTFCASGANKVYELLGAPLSDYELLKERSESIRFFFEYSLFDIQIDKDALSFVEYYQKQRRNTIRPTWATAFSKRVFDKLNGDAQYHLMAKGVRSTIQILKWVKSFLLPLTDGCNRAGVPAMLLAQSEKVKEIFEKNNYNKLLTQRKIGKYLTVGDLDYRFRLLERRDILFLLDLIYQYDAFSTIAKVAKEKGFAFADLYKEDEGRIEMKGLFHPLLENAVANDISFDKNSNILFLTGPNMAGKSTLLKAVSIAVFLAHCGFPVPARSMNISVLSGLCTTINIADDLSSGYSHFYAEVMRIKEVALKLKERKNMLVIFDELFRGTNVKDAYDGTEAVIKAFSNVGGAFFVVSTHIVEVADELKKLKNIKFNYLGIEQKDGHPIYSYRVKDGLSKDRLGLYIIQQEGIIDLINEIK